MRTRTWPPVTRTSSISPRSITVSGSSGSTTVASASQIWSSNVRVIGMAAWVCPSSRFRVSAFPRSRFFSPFGLRVRTPDGGHLIEQDAQIIAVAAGAASRPFPAICGRKPEADTLQHSGNALAPPGQLFYWGDWDNTRTQLLLAGYRLEYPQGLRPGAVQSL